MDLDWFWRGWFYSTDHVDISLDRVVKMRLDTSDPEIEKAWERNSSRQSPPTGSAPRTRPPVSCHARSATPN